MMHFTLKVTCDNAAFDLWEVELPRLLREAAEKLERYETSSTLRDVNGNPVGEFALVGRRPRE